MNVSTDDGEVNTSAFHCRGRGVGVYSVLAATPNWFDSHQYIALWLEGIALLAIFIWDRIDASQQHKQTLTQMGIMQNQARATETAANAATKSAEALISSERAWII